MLVLSRKAGQRIAVGNDIEITVLRLGGGKVRLGIDAPGDVAIRRSELIEDVAAHDAGDEGSADEGRAQDAA